MDHDSLFTLKGFGEGGTLVLMGVGLVKSLYFE